MPTSSTLKDIRSMSLPELEEMISSFGEPGYRAKQIYAWLWKQGATTIDEMTNLGKSLRQKLKESYTIRPVQTEVTQISRDQTIKNRHLLWDGNRIESVLIPVPEDRRFTVCVSSQVGCSLSCTFCATGQMKRMRNLDPGEIYDQVKIVNQQSMAHFDHPLTNIVFMGMGEPLLNYKNVLRSTELICSPDGLGFSARRVTISTAGIAKMIQRLADDNAKINLALSLHAADDEKRNQIMPINAQNNLSVLVDALDYYYQKTRNKISYEYIAFRNFNDSIDDARRLASLCRRFPVLVNIIEYNPIDGVSFEKSDRLTVDQFAKVLRAEGIMVTVRKSRGQDIDAACGQLANKE